MIYSKAELAEATMNAKLRQVLEDWLSELCSRQYGRGVAWQADIRALQERIERGLCIGNEHPGWLPRTQPKKCWHCGKRKDD